jgi:N-acetylated-alpha-linked acidic dipeptidase
MPTCFRTTTAPTARTSWAKLTVDFSPVTTAAERFEAAGGKVYVLQSTAAPGADDAKLNTALRDAETALLNDAGLPRRPWYKHTIYAPGEYTGYAAVVIPGVTEGIEADDAPRTQAQLDALTAALNRSAEILESVTK